MGLYSIATSVIFVTAGITHASFLPEIRLPTEPSDLSGTLIPIDFGSTVPTILPVETSMPTDTPAQGDWRTASSSNMSNLHLYISEQGFRKCATLALIFFLVVLALVSRRRASAQHVAPFLYYPADYHDDDAAGTTTKLESPSPGHPLDASSTKRAHIPPSSSSVSADAAPAPSPSPADAHAAESARRRAAMEAQRAQARAVLAKRREILRDGSQGRTSNGPQGRGRGWAGRTGLSLR